MLKDGKPQRRCIGCMESFDQIDMIRMTAVDGRIQIDRDGKAPGRGFYLCRNESCLDQAIKKKALNRVLKGAPDNSDIELIRQEIIKPEDN